MAEAIDVGKWAVWITKDPDGVHVVPTDGPEHVLMEAECWCGPAINNVGAIEDGEEKPLIVHNRPQ